MPSQTKSTTSITSTDVVGGNARWNDPTQANRSDNRYAYATFSRGVTETEYLCAYDFGFTIPSGSTIDGILVQIEKSVVLTSEIEIYDQAVFLTLGYPIATGDSKPDPRAWSETDEVVDYGGATDIWGIGWTAFDINSGVFGVCLKAYESTDSDARAQVDSISITVYYTVPLMPCLDLVIPIGG